VSSSPASNCSSSSRVDQNSSLAKLLTANPVRNYDNAGTDISAHEKSGTTVTKSTSQHEGAIPINRNYSNSSGLSSKSTMQYQQRSSMNVGNQGDENRRRCNNLARIPMMTNSNDSPVTNVTLHGNLQTDFQVSKRGERNVHL
jgi:hypothetical protein